MEKNHFSYFDHAADIGIAGYGDTIERAFIAAAEAIFNIMTPLPRVQLTHSFEIQFDEPDIELALVTWLNLLLAESISRNWILANFQLQRHNSHWQGKAFGEPWHEELERGTDVKGATLTMLSVKKINDQWEARCIVDV